MAAQADEVAVSERGQAHRTVSLRDSSACTFLSRNEIVMSVRRTSACWVAALGAALSLATLASAGGAVGDPYKTCGNVSGPHWSIGGRSGTQYVVSSPNGAPCSLALSCAPRLVTQRYSRSNFLLKGPAGWDCVGTFAFPHGGYCAQKSSQKVFGWAPTVR